VSEKNMSEKLDAMKEVAGEGCWKRLSSCVVELPPYISALYSEVRLAIQLVSSAFHKSLPASST